MFLIGDWKKRILYIKVCMQKKNRHWAWKRCPVSSLLLAFTSAWHQIYWGAAECYSQCSISCTFSTCKFHLCVVLNLHTYLLFTYTLLKILHILHFYLCIFRGIWEIVWKCKTLKYLKFKFSEKATKISLNLPPGLDITSKLPWRR